MSRDTQRRSEEAPRRSDGAPKDSRRAHLLVCAALLTTAAAAHFWYLGHHCPLDLSGDEAHYWEWSRHPALSYYSKGPLVAYIIGFSRWLCAGWSNRLVGTELLAVRLPAVLLSVLTGLGVYTLALNVLRRSRPALAAVALTFVVPILAAGSLLMTIDAPLVCAWTWTLVLLHRGLERDTPGAWLGAGLLIAVGVLAKYTMLLIFPTFGLLLVTDPRLRRLLKRPGPYVATAVGLTGLIPIVIWNITHNWLSARHVAGQAGVAHALTVDLRGVLVYLGGQAGVMGGLWFVAMIWAWLALRARPCDKPFETHDTASIKLLLFATGVPWLVFLAFSPITKIQPNWPVVALVPAAILMSVWLARRLRLPTPQGRMGARVFIAAGVLVGGSMVVVMHHTSWLYPVFARMARDAAPWDLTPVARYDPAARLRGWSELGTAVAAVLRQQHAAGRDPFIAADNYQVASEVAFYCPGRPTTYCLQSALGGRMNQYDLWPNPIRDRRRFEGRPCVYVGSLHPALTGKPGTRGALRGLRLARTVVHQVRGYPARVWAIYTSDSFVGFDTRATGVRKY